ncbi:hypothetical protein K2173_021490 [Erythroxylum novogranatense]|uniref:Uncharacterized protein n=1 Tax=Erythroxylum novogranatense TaxID=1862640 RepID=A0AAV8TN01_9ROSI|nr:hypothetical protein K2173_021490 [Erythroxylum novogranatense]
MDINYVCGGNGGGLSTKPPCLFSFRLLPLRAPVFHYNRRRIHIIVAGDSGLDSNADDLESRRLKSSNGAGIGKGNANNNVGRGASTWKRKWLTEGMKREAEGEEGQEPGILKEALDSIWIFEVFRSFGWTLPPILLSLFLATDPKAFLMALALTVGQSVFTFVFRKLLGRINGKPKRMTKNRRKPFANFRNDDKINIEQLEKEAEMVKMGYQSWVDDSGSVNVDRQGVHHFGGWDDLDKSDFVPCPPQVVGQSKRKSLANGRLSPMGAKEEIPLYMKLLVAMFPFLSSWTKML